MVQKLEQALHTIKSTMYHHQNDAYFPYFFVVGAGISVPEIPSASKIVDICKETVKEIDPERFAEYDEATKHYSENGMKYYSSWIEYAYPNRVNRSQLFKSLCSKAKISSANLMLAQILHSGEFANTVFTTNFDDSLKKALELMGTKNFFCAENIMDNLVISNQTKDIQIVHVHGTFNFYDCANLEKEIDCIASQTGAVSSAQLLSSFLANQAPIIVGYSGWENDVIMRCLKERLNYPTPLQYIWICYNKQSYNNLPVWIKEKESVIFVIPESDDGDCSEVGDALSWDASSNADSIDATAFFKRIISNFKLKAPLIFTDPYSYYSKKIREILPKDEDVLHLRHWTQRLRIIESDDVFEKLVQRLETLYIAKDYDEANSVLSEMIDLPLSEANAEFVCTSLIKEFIRDEDVVSPFEIRLKFHLTALAFVEKNLSQLSRVKSLISTLRAILFTRFRHAEKDKAIGLFEKVIELCSKDERLLPIELTALGTKSDFVEREQKVTMLQDVLARCPKETTDKNFVFLKYKALRELARQEHSDGAIHLIEQAEEMANMLDVDIYSVYLCTTKSELMPYITNREIKKKWGKEIIDALSVINIDIDIDTYIEIAANLSYLRDADVFSFASAAEIEEITIRLLAGYSVDHSSCHSILHYSQCCELICRATGNNATLAEFCRKVFEVMPLFPHECKSYLMTLRVLAKRFISLSADVVAEAEKIDFIVRLKENEYTNSLYLPLLHYVSSNNLIEDLSMFDADVAYILDQREKVQKGYDLYCNGDHAQAELLFVEVTGCKVPSIADFARTNLTYMVRRNETQGSYSFEEVICRTEYWSEFDLMNILLYYIAKGEINSDKYLRAKKQLDKISDEERDNIIEWWRNVERVGEEESKLALSLINCGS